MPTDTTTQDLTEEIRGLFDTQIGHFANSSDDRYLASSHYNGEVKVWDVLTWELLRTMPAGDYDIAFSPDGKMIAGTRKGYVNLWWVEDGTRVAQLTGSTGWIHPVDFSEVKHRTVNSRLSTPHLFKAKALPANAAPTHGQIPPLNRTLSITIG